MPGENRAGPALQFLDYIGSNCRIVEWDGSGGENLDLFVALAGEQHDVSRLGGADGELDGGAAVGLDDATRTGGLDAGESLVEDGRGIFGARVVAGEDDQIAALAGGAAHLGALSAVAVAAAAEESDDSALRVAGTAVGYELAGQGDEVAQGIVGVGVVDDDGDAVAGRHDLEATGDLRTLRGAASRL
jgi:hypothetical protein